MTWDFYSSKFDGYGIYMFKLEVSALSRGPMVTWGSPFWETSIENCFAKFRYEYALLTSYTSGMILEEVIKHMVVTQKM